MNYEEAIKTFEKAMAQQFTIALYVVQESDKYKVALERIANLDPHHGEAQTIARNALGEN